jgi:hypothetical protein
MGSFSSDWIYLSTWHSYEHFISCMIYLTTTYVYEIVSWSYWEVILISIIILALYWPLHFVSSLIGQSEWPSCLISHPSRPFCCKEWSFTAHFLYLSSCRKEGFDYNHPPSWIREHRILSRNNDTYKKESNKPPYNSIDSQIFRPLQ